MFDRIEAFFYAHMYGEWESLRRWLWIYGHVSILLATALAGYAFARGAYLLTLLLVPFPLVYLYRRSRPSASGLDPEAVHKRYEKARTYKVQSDTPV